MPSYAQRETSYTLSRALLPVSLRPRPYEDSSSLRADSAAADANIPPVLRGGNYPSPLKMKNVHLMYALYLHEKTFIICT